MAGVNEKKYKKKAHISSDPFDFWTKFITQSREMIVAKKSWFGISLFWEKRFILENEKLTNEIKK